MIVMHVVGWFDSVLEAMAACPRLKAMVDAYGYYCSRYEDRVWGLEPIGEWGGYQGVFKTLQEWPYKIIFIGGHIVCDGMIVELMVVRGEKPEDVRLMYVLGGRYATRVGLNQVSIGPAPL